MTKLTLAAALALSLSSAAAFAQAAPAAAPAMAPAASTAAPMMKKGQKPRTAQSLECSKKADAANVHGKPRSAFMRKCKDGKA
ncbi:phosphate starvation-inducible protein PsiF [Lichenibacterium minor]|uniref:Phosphate starvation-inducible protein PsiF n=1 Tax=Lichenibacterium minor TaxID=2316528 RepID=A0A4Q2U9J8_9HYPH|nr:PsiF family protein [Lichenibacterium minor]RYC32598.1 phosphate starvation-inducible protein PsiF [Lichenibacterium minor]